MIFIQGEIGSLLLETAQESQTTDIDDLKVLWIPNPRKFENSSPSHHSSPVPYRLCRRVAGQSLLEMSRNRVAHHLWHGRDATWSGEFLLSAVKSQFFFRDFLEESSSAFNIKVRYFGEGSQEVRGLRRGCRNCPRWGQQQFRQPLRSSHSDPGSRHPC